MLSREINKTKEKEEKRTNYSLRLMGSWSEILYRAVCRGGVRYMLMGVLFALGGGAWLLWARCWAVCGKTRASCVWRVPFYPALDLGEAQGLRFSLPGGGQRWAVLGKGEPNTHYTTLTTTPRTHTKQYTNSVAPTLGFALDMLLTSHWPHLALHSSTWSCTQCCISF